MADVNATLAERGTRYGEFDDHATIAQAIKDIMRATPGWSRLTPAMKESLEMQAHKQARILNGDPFYADSWHDIGGYTKLVEDILARGAKAPEEAPKAPFPGTGVPPAAVSGAPIPAPAPVAAPAPVVAPPRPATVTPFPTVPATPPTVKVPDMPPAPTKPQL